MIMIKFCWVSTEWSPFWAIVFSQKDLTVWIMNPSINCLRGNYIFSVQTIIFVKFLRAT